jgi:hypothetical protein
MPSYCGGHNSKGGNSREGKVQQLGQLTAEGILFADQYQLSMAQLYCRPGLHEKTAQFGRCTQVIISHGETLLQPDDIIVVLTQQDTADAACRALEGEE